MPPRRQLIAVALLFLLVVAPRAAAETLLVLGDSLTAGYGVAEEEAWPALVAVRLRATHPTWTAVNAGVSGDTTSGALRRLDRLLAGRRPDLVLVALGANDGMRGQGPEGTAANLEAIVARCRAAGARVALAGQRVPPSLGEEHAGRFAAVYPALAEHLHLPLLPFLLDGVAGDPALNLADGIHPNPAGHRRIAAAVWRFLEPLLAPPAP